MPSPPEDSGKAGLLRPKQESDAHPSHLISSPLRSRHHGQLQGLPAARAAHLLDPLFGNRGPRRRVPGREAAVSRPERAVHRGVPTCRTALPPATVRGTAEPLSPAPIAVCLPAPTAGISPLPALPTDPGLALRALLPRRLRRGARRLGLPRGLRGGAPRWAGGHGQGGWG